MKVALCCIGRMENQYAREFVEHYKKLCFDKIFIYDNNHDGEEHFEDVLQDYIDEHFVDIVNFRNIENAQLLAYNDCYQKNNEEYDWIAFFDFDEFLTLVRCKTVKSYLKRFNGYDVVKINWMLYNDNNLIINDHRPVLERFTTPIEYNKPYSYSFPENNHVKSIIRGGIKDFKWVGNPHVPGMELRFSNSIGEKSDSSPFQHYNFKKAFIKHFSMKTIDEYFNVKRIRGQAGVNYKSFIDKYSINDFFKINERTQEKIDYIDEILNKNKSFMKYITISDLSETIRKNIWKIPRDIDFIIGVPRSGMIGASIIASYLNIPLIDVNSFLVGLEPSGGLRLGYFNSKHKKTNKVLVVDDTVSSGRAMKETKRKLESGRGKDFELIYACVYLEGWGIDAIDFYLEDLRQYTNNFTSYVLYEWNILQHHSDVMDKFLFDIDGVFCVDPPDERNEEEYINYIKNAKPLFIPQTKIGGIITYRLAKNREITEKWLHNNGIIYNKLMMFNANSWEERNNKGIPPEVYKGNFYKNNNNYSLFVESSDYQAKRISEISKKPVYCVESNKLYQIQTTNINIDNDNVDIFVGAYKPFKIPVTNKAYKIIVGNHKIENKSNTELIECGNKNDILDDEFYSELYMLKNISNNRELKKYVGYCHYRKYFNFLDNIPNLDNMLLQYDCIVAKPLVLKTTIREQYAMNHNIEDFNIVEKIIAEKYPSYVNSWNNFLNGNIFIPYNMFIMKKDDFKKYIKFIFGVLDEYVKIVGTDIKKRIEDNKEKYLKDFYPNNTVEYQYRIGGYLGERLTNVFLMNNFTKMKTYHVIVTEDKYKQNKKDNP